MTQNPNWLSIAAVHRRTGKARSTIASHIKKGELSVVMDEKGKTFIEASEAARVYGADFDLNEGGSNASATKRIETSRKESGDSQLIEEMKKHRASLDEIIKGLRSDLEKSQEREENKMLLLTHQSDASDHIKEAIKVAVSDELKEDMNELRIALAAKEIEAKKLKMKLRAEMNRSWIDRLLNRRRGGGSKQA